MSDNNDGGFHIRKFKATVGVKTDSGKLQYGLIPPEASKALAKVLTWACTRTAPKPYPPNNWMHVEPFQERYTEGLLRHIEAWRGGETHDSESGFHHLEHALCNLTFLVWGIAKGKVK